MITNLWDKTNYICPFPYVINNYITEYDIGKANINVLLCKGVLSKEVYDKLLVSDRDYREIYVGMMQRRDHGIYEILKEGITEFRKKFCEANELEDRDILSIKNDAIYVIGKKCKYKTFDNIIFNDKNSYTLFIKLAKLEVYYNYDTISDNEVIDIKGISDETMYLHQSFMISFLCDVFYKLQNSSIDDAVKTYGDFYEAYISRTLPIGFYREFNSDSMYRINTNMESFGLYEVQQKDIKSIDIGYNLNILRDLHGVLSDIYFNRKK